LCVDPQFAPLNDDQRLSLFFKKTKLHSDFNSQPALASNLSIILCTPDEREIDYDFVDSSSAGQHWLPLLDPAILDEHLPGEDAKPPTIHFYGFKGGQARSTVLAMLSKSLADDGYRVLVVDADIEAPSLDTLLNTAANSPSQTLLGILNEEEKIEPLPAYASTQGKGKVDLIACRPSSRDFDMDFAAFALRTALDVNLLERGTARLLTQIKNKGNHLYDVLLFDHRSGLATSVLPIMKACPGPAVACLRIDDQSSNATPIFDILFSQSKEIPGAYVSFSLDPEETRENMLGTKGAKISDLLDRLGEAIERGSTEYKTAGKDLPPEDFLRYWVSWFHDRAFLTDNFPDLSEISERNRDSIRQLREVLALSIPSPARRPRKRRRSTSPTKLSPSGSGDEGIFIETQEIARLLQPNTTITYIFGRKGTGKTRLLRELQNRKLGEALVIAADATGGGLPTGDTLFQDLAATFADDPDKIWWCLIAAALQSPNTTESEFRDKIKAWEKKAQNKRLFRTSEIAEIANALPQRRVFLIDGIETAFKSSTLIESVESLFRVLLTIQSDVAFSKNVVIRLFLRTDLAKRAIQNVEQQTAGRRLDLSWNVQSIFNFVLSRIAQLEWFQANFPESCKTIQKENKKIKAGLLPASEYEPLLLDIFPRHLRRNNLQTLTFLKTYFSDAAGDEETRAAFYPRLFDAFLHYIAHPEELPHGASPLKSLEDGLVNQLLVLNSHEASSRRFLDEVKQELTVLLDLAKKPSDNEIRVSQLLAAFDGLPTPFQLEICLKKIKDIIPKVDIADLREALHRMKEVGMFEDRPGYSGWWRAGRLFKSALRMKYVR
jgi:hypothetical protein